MSWFSALFNKDAGSNIALLSDYASVHTDFHSHLIPSIDDGSQSTEDSVKLLQGLAGLGFKKVITTPHVMSDYYRNSDQTILEGLELLQNLVRENNIPLQLGAAAEYYLDDELLQRISKQPLLTLGDSFLLFEVSYINAPDNINRAVFEMKVNGYKPLLAHPERYPFWSNRFDVFEGLKEQGVYFQLNTISLSGYYGIGPKRTAEKLIDAGMIDFIGSDMHHERHLEALGNTLKEKYLARLVAKGIRNAAL
jgi:tyrosine-protein phosphatase YwqE